MHLPRRTAADNRPTLGELRVRFPIVEGVDWGVAPTGGESVEDDGVGVLEAGGQPCWSD